MFEDSVKKNLVFQPFLHCFKWVRNFVSIRLFIQVLIFLVGLSISGFGLFQLLGNTSQVFSSDTNQVDAVNIDSVSNINDTADTSMICEKDPEFGRLTVDIGGAVKNPGVYELDTGSRMNDLINIAGGFSDVVDKYYINKVLNLSEHLTDGKKFYIPTLEESIEIQELTQKDELLQSDMSTNIVSINSSSVSELTNLTGIGEKRANDIVVGRPYNSTQQLVENKIITESIFENIKNDISL